MLKRAVCALIGCTAGGFAGFGLRQLGVPPVFTPVWGLAGILLALRYAGRKRWIPAAEEVHRPIRLFEPPPRS